MSRREIEDDEARTVETDEEETAELEDSAELEELERASADELDKARLSEAPCKESATVESLFRESETRTESAGSFAVSEESAGGISDELESACPGKLEELENTDDELETFEELLAKTLELDASEPLETDDEETASSASDEDETTAKESAAFVSSSNSANRSRTCANAAADIKKKHRQKTRNRMGKIYKIRKDKRREPPYFAFDMLCSRMPPIKDLLVWHLNNPVRNGSGIYRFLACSPAKHS